MSQELLTTALLTTGIVFNAYVIFRVADDLRTLRAQVQDEKSRQVQWQANHTKQTHGTITHRLDRIEGKG
jgi:cell division protein FtsL